MEHAGTRSALIGICGSAIITNIFCMGELAGSGANIDVLVCMHIACELISVILTDIGSVCARIGTCGRRIITTVQISGPGVNSDVLAGIGTD